MSSSDNKPDQVSTATWNVPNVLSAARIVLAVFCFAALEMGGYTAALVLFIVATATDWLDGYWARRFGQITQLGRILDPFADKLLVCGLFVYLAAIPELCVPAWMAVVVLSRELLVTALRSFVESTGGDFSAKWAGKWKMALQCAAIVLALYQLTPATRPDWLPQLTLVVLWLAVGLTLYSGLTYVLSAITMARRL